MIRSGFKGSLVSLLTVAAITACPVAIARAKQSVAIAEPKAKAIAQQSGFPNQADILAAVKLSNEGNSPTAIKTLTPLAEKGNALAQNALGLVYMSAPDMKPDYTQAIGWYKKSAALGFGGAYSNLGYMASNGFGTPKSSSEAAKWFTLAAATGSYLGQFNLGRLYETGEGVPKNAGEAVRLYKLAGAQGYATANHNLGTMYADGAGIPKDFAEARRYYVRASESGYGGSTNALGVMVLRGEGQKSDPKAAYTYFLKAAQQWEPLAFNNLGVVHRDGIIGKIDLAKALGFFAIGSSLENADAKTNLAALLKKTTAADHKAAEAFAKRCLDSQAVDCD
jgi:uncharacterized protein